ncbi:MAG TPA: RidA family protein [Acidimicrobiales bacterium]|jgi:enamine deaminase RidA (YjgF/YER057c/UK114 family)
MKEHLNPETLASNPAFSQVVVVREPAATIYVGGQNAVTPTGDIVGDGLREQTMQTLRNVRAAIVAAGASLNDVVRWTVSIIDGQPLQEGFAAFAEECGDVVDPPAISVQIVAGLANPRFLVEVDAVAVL